MCPDFKGSGGSVLIMLHPLKVGIQKKLMEFAPRRRIEQLLMAKILNETINRVAHSPQMGFP